MKQREKQMQQFLGKTVSVTVDRPVGHLHKGIVYPINYGYLPGVLGGDGEEQDAYIFGIDTPLQHFEGTVVGVIMRKDDCEDKLVVAPAGIMPHQAQILEAVRFQEQYFSSYVICLLERSCGVLPWRENKGEPEYLLVFEHFSKCWSLPKGHMEPGETEAMTALRELQEETGLDAALDTTRSATMEYPISPFCRKQVVIFPGKVSGEPKPRPGEIDSFQWVRAEALSQYLFPDTCRAIASLLRPLCE